MADIKKGDRVRILVNTPLGEPVDGVVKVVQDKVGKPIGVQLDNFIAYGHELDGATDEKVKTDSKTGISYGTGWWTLPENVEVL